MYRRTLPGINCEKCTKTCRETTVCVCRDSHEGRTLYTKFTLSRQRRPRYKNGHIQKVSHDLKELIQKTKLLVSTVLLCREFGELGVCEIFSLFCERFFILFNCFILAIAPRELIRCRRWATHVIFSLADRHGTSSSSSSSLSSGSSMGPVEILSEELVTMSGTGKMLGRLLPEEADKKNESSSDGAFF